MLLPLLCVIALPAAAQEPVAAGGYRWLEEGPFAGPLYLVISIDRQMAHVYDGDRLVGIASVSTGMKGHRTPTGEFPVLQKREWHRSNLYSNAPMPFMQRLTWDGIALHAGHNPGYPASHGCIRLPHAFARRLFEMTQVGTLVSVTSDRLSPVLMVDALVVGDPGSAVVTFAPPSPPPSAPPAAPSVKPVMLAQRDEPPMPMLEVDPGIFRLRLMRR
ncbi:L,D-transpeptidase family protein [Sphingobium sp. JS3065]|uniref:L,D-transpeptidase family protein n=1 Tax=Sphingobium sp. JS3065 TaxID=2970925 RepID=UPI002263D2B6|nr:L,D-transpeptidase family protein [Sphingobium sp. JS3065]UZW56875.1 L,D-transpeptidase family protein [Sphingobium sp. JS3065]